MFSYRHSAIETNNAEVELINLNAMITQTNAFALKSLFVLRKMQMKVQILAEMY
jgi:hypothetical protein